MDQRSPREILASLIMEKGDNYGSLSRLIGRNAAYIQQFIKRGTPKKLDEEDRRILARYFDVDEALLGGRAEEDSRPHPGLFSAKKQFRNSAVSLVPQLRIEVSAGAGMIAGDEQPAGAVGFDSRWLKSLGLSPENLSIIDVNGESMSPTLNNGDTIMVDLSDNAMRLRDGIYVLRLDDALMVKRVALSPRTGRRALTISSDNAHFPTWEDVDPALVDIVGRVVWASRIFA
jgi:phage repressor protein C with HTH and peptisase S24 domain